ncbi:ABC-2 family transporter protein [Ruminococcus sp. BSD2780120874_150323_B10]|uniref:ABC transporter permease n=1 Tax=Ruminococcus sp. BSD2780120874_150323_B10 TaxID=2787127 RepID=UPI001896D00D|nr:ABC-2 family transporter protein [Ruminococcus sp. BSD2780120874_150323_B10]
MKELRRAMKMHRIFIVQELKRMMEYKGDFLTSVIGFLIVQVFNILFLNIIFSQIPNLKGWSFYEILFIYGFSLIPKGIDHMFFDNLWAMGHWLVRKGDFDKYLTRPINPMFHVMAEKFQVDAFGELVVGIGLIVTAVPHIAIEWSFLRVLLTLIAMFFASFIYTGIKIGTAAISFWTKRSGNITYMFYMMNDFVKYPVDIYNNFIRNLITYIIPFAFTSYFPAMYFMTGENPLLNIGLTVFVSVIVMAIGIVIWNIGIKNYESAGS